MMKHCRPDILLFYRITNIFSRFFLYNTKQSLSVSAFPSIVATPCAFERPLHAKMYEHCFVLCWLVAGVCNRLMLFLEGCLNRHQTILHTFLNFFLNLTLSGVPHLYKQLPNGQYLSDFCKICNLEGYLWKIWIGDHRILTYIFKRERLNTAGQSHPVSISHWVAPLYRD